MADFQTLIQNAFVGKALSSANTWVNVGQITGSGQYANLSLNVTNTSPTSTAIVSIAISNQASLPNTDDIIESNLSLAPNGGTLSRQNIIASVGEYVYILSNTDTVSIRMSGIIQALQSMEQLDSEIMSLSSQQETDMANINSLSSQQETDMANIANLTTQLAQDDQTLQDEINALTTSLNNDNANLQNQINALSSALASTQSELTSTQTALASTQTALTSTASSLSSTTSSLSGTTTSLSSSSANLQNQINALSSSLNSDVSSLQGQINNNNISNLFTNVTFPSRGLGGTYYNQTGKPMFVQVVADEINAGENALGLTMYINGSQVGQFVNSNGGATCFVSAIVPNGASYQVNSYNNATIAIWVEIY